MNFIEWNNAIIKHFFNSENENKEVILYFSESVIEEIGENNFLKPEIGYVEDFYSAMRKGIRGITDNNYIQKILSIDDKYQQGCRVIDGIPFNYPPYLSCMLTFCIPFTSGAASKNHNMNNFHDFVQEFFKEKELADNYDLFIRNHLNDIDHLWMKINDWLITTNNYNLGYLIIPDPPQQRRYVGKYEYHILFRKEQEERLAIIFDENDILPGSAISNNEIRDLLVKNYQKLNLSEDIRDSINDAKDYIGNLIVKRALIYFTNWDGTTPTMMVKTTASNISAMVDSNSVPEAHRGFSRDRLALCLDFNLITESIKLKYFRIFSKSGIPDNLELKNEFTKIIVNDIYQVNLFYSNPIKDNFMNLDTDVKFIDEAARKKYSWKSNKLYLFKKISNFDWVEIAKVEHNSDKTLIICKKEYYERELKLWFDDIKTNKKLYVNNQKSSLPNDWLAFTIDNISNYPISTVSELTSDNENKPLIVFEKSFYTDCTLFKNILPTVRVENAELNGAISAKYKDGSELPLNILQFEEDGVGIKNKQYSFTCEHVANTMLNQQFKLFYNEISTHQFLQISEFKKLENDIVENILPPKDGIGQITDVQDNYLKGLEHFYSNEIISTLHPQQQQLNNIFINKYTNNIIGTGDYNPMHYGNILIHYISTKGKLTKKEFKDCIFSLLEKSSKNEANGKEAIDQLGYLLQEMGYLDYNNENGTYYINKTHLVVIPSDRGTTFKLVGAIDYNLIKGISNYCRQHNNITMSIITDAGNEILPQAIYLHLRQCDHSLIKPLVKKYNIIYNKANLFTQFALISSFPDIGKWENYIKKTPDNTFQNTDGGYIFDIEKLSFINKPLEFQKNLSLVMFKNINGYKTVYRLWYNNNCYNIPDRQIGVYIFLYLYMKIRNDNYNKCADEKGSVNCYVENEQKKLAQTKTNVVVYDRDNNLLAVPESCRLPRYVSLSLQLLSGNMPLRKYLNIEGVRYKGIYHIYQNVPNLFLQNTVNLKLLKTELLNPIMNKKINL